MRCSNMEEEAVRKMSSTYRSKEAMLEIRTLIVDKQRSVGPSLNKANGLDICGKAAIPSTRGLLLTVEGLHEATDIVKRARSMEHDGREQYTILDKVP